MGLRYPGDWKFEGIGVGIPPEGVGALRDLVLMIAGDSWPTIEAFKSAFGDPHSSTTMGFAISDLSSAMSRQSANAVAFVDSLWSGIEAAQAAGLAVPSAKVVNKLLKDHGVPLQIQPPHLLLTEGDALLTSPVDAGAGQGPIPLFSLAEQIGAGGYGRVFRATRSTALGTFEYAIKILDPSPFVTNYDKAVQRFQREIRAVQSIQHRAIVPYYEAGLTFDQKPYIVMPYLRGHDLRTATSADDVATTLGIFVELASALAYAHGLNVLHRDLKPSNVIVRQSDRQPIILDFGAAYLLNDPDALDLTTTAVGTAGYVPSDVIANPTARSPLQDVYACGVMLYECIARFLPDPAHYEPLTAIDPALAPVDSIVQSAIAGAATRTATATALHADLVRALAAF